MDKKILNLLNKWKENNLITDSTYQEIVEFESNSSPTQKSKVAKAITLIGSLFLLSGLLGTLPLIWDNLTYWAQLLLLVVTTVFLIYAANYSEKFEDKNIFIYTDGVTEGYIEGDNEFTVKGVEDEVLKNSSSDIKEIIDQITDKLNNREKLRDDITCMAINIENTELIKKK